MNDKVVLITGSAAGIGDAAAKAFAAQGAKLALVDLKETGGDVVQTFKNQGTEAVFFSG